MHKIKYALFYDNHTHIENPDVGINFDVEHFTDEIKRCGVDYLAFHARCNQGLTYYDTKVGMRHPALKYDLFGRLAEACKRKNIVLSAYFNGGISTMEAINHIEWRAFPMPGHTLFGKVSPHAVTMCYNSPYRQHLLDMIKEVAENYPVSGFFFDCLQPYPCVCPVCSAKMKEQGIDYQDFDAVTEFQRQSVLSLCKEIADVVNSHIKEPFLFFNGPFFGPVKELDTFFDCECLPTGGWGYECLPILAHSTRNITPGKQILNMTGRFYAWGDFGGLRPAESLKFDLFYGLAHGMRPNIGGHFHPRGDKDQAVFDRIREVYIELQKYDEYYEDAVNLTDVGLIYPQEGKSFRLSNPIFSACRMLDELKIQFDILFADCDKPWNNYKVIVLPENVGITPELERKVKEYIAQGGKFFACGSEAAEKFGSELGIEYAGDSGMDPVYFKMNEKFGDNIENMFNSLYAPACKALAKNAETAAFLVKPYYNTGWNGQYAMFYTPPEKETEIPFITVNGNCVWCAGDLFTGYFNRGALHLREILKNIIFSLHEKMLFVNENLPSFVRSTVTQQENSLNINLIAYAPEKRGEAFVVEDGAVVADGKFKVFIGEKTVKSVKRVNSDGTLDFEVKDNYIEIHIPLFKGYELLNVEFLR